MLKNAEEEQRLQSLQHKRDADESKSELDVLQETNKSQSEQLTLLSASNESLKAKESTLTEEIITFKNESSKMTETIAKARLLFHYNDALSGLSCFSCNKKRMNWRPVCSYQNPAPIRWEETWRVETLKSSLWRETRGIFWINAPQLKVTTTHFKGGSRFLKTNVKL